MVTTIVHSQNNDLMNQPKFKETENWNNLSKLSQNETGIIDSDHYLKNDNLTSLKELTIDSRYKYKQKLDENLDNEQSLTEKVKNYFK